MNPQEKKDYVLSNINSFKSFIKEKKEKRRVSFIGHEGLSAYMAIDILNNTDISVEDKIMIVKIIALHGVIRDYIDDDRNLRKEKFLEVFKGEKTLMEHVIRQVQADSCGRFGVDIHRPLIQLIPEFRELIAQLSDGIEFERDYDKPQLTILVGPPTSGKSTFCKSIEDDIRKKATIKIAEEFLKKEVK